MTDTLRSIVNEMVHSPSSEIVRGDGVVESRICLPSCYRCRLEALLAEYEKVDLVKKLRLHEDGVCEHVRLTGCDDKRSCYEVDAAELETWLAVNLERIKAQAERDGATKVLSWAARLYCQCEELAPLKCSIHNFMAELDDSPIALEARAKEKP